MTSEQAFMLAIPAIIVYIALSLLASTIAESKGYAKKHWLAACLFFPAPFVLAFALMLAPRH